MTQIVSDFSYDLLTIEALEHRLVFVQRVARKVIEVSEGVLAFEKPGDFEVWLEVKMRVVIVVLVVDLTLVLLEEFRFVVWVGLTFHPGYALETTRLG